MFKCTYLSRRNVIIMAQTILCLSFWNEELNANVRIATSFLFNMLENNSLKSCMFLEDILRYII